ncbi:protein kinase domain-containing protein [Phthorimaea operculella]|nr:protein kinase domain-containing protein [Phthorimaea operculella]
MSKDKWIRRFSVDETARHKNGFTIYKITSVLFPIESPETITVISVWKRYSDIQKLHTSMKSLHAGLHLRGTFPVLPKFSYFKRFQQEVIEERAKVVKSVLEFIAEHKLLFTSTDFVNFLQTGYPEPETSSSGVINSIRTSLHLPIEETPPLEYQTSDDDSRSPQHSAKPPESRDEPDFISQIPIYSSHDIEKRVSPIMSRADSFQSIDSLDSIGSDLYNELDKVTVPKTSPMVKKIVLPDLINFDAPSTSKFDDYHTMTNDDSTSISSNQNSQYSASIASTNQLSESFTSTNQSLESKTSAKCQDYTRSSSRVSVNSVLSLSNLANIECKTKTEDSYVFEAGYMLNLAARYEDMKEYAKAFECYKAGIEKMLIGVQMDSDHQRRALIKEKTNKYLSYAEAIYKNHLCNAEQSLLPPRSPTPRLHCPLPVSMLRRPYEDLVLYRVLAVLADSIMLVLHRGEQTCYAMKVIQKIPNNLTEFDEYFLQNTNETRAPILPTVIPYMVPLHAYIETNNLIFLILAYAPGEKLFDYIKNYAKSVPNTPAREVNLENVFSEPKSNNLFSSEYKTVDDFSEKTISDNFSGVRISDVENENLDIESIIAVKSDTNSEFSIIDKLDESSNNNNETEDDEIKELVKNSQNLLKNVDKVLSEVKKVDESVKIEDVNIEITDTSEDAKEVKILHKYERIETPRSERLSPRTRDILPPATIACWGAQILTALESLHNYGVICRDLNPSNILLSDGGQVILTYFIYYPGLEMSLDKLHNKQNELNLYIAPELYRYTYLEERDEDLEKVCDFWSFGAIMYELLCGVPLSYYHRGVFTSHTLLQMPDGLPLEAQSLLTQLLTYEPSERLGGGKEGIEEIKRHPYFKHINWAEIYDNWKVPD